MTAALPVSYEMVDGRMYAFTSLPNGQIVSSSIDMSPVVGAVCDEVGATDDERLAAYGTYCGGVDIVGAICGYDDWSDDDQDEVSGRRRRKKRRAKRKARRKKVFAKVRSVAKKVGRAVKKVAKPIVKAAKKIAKSKLVKGIVKLAKKIPIYGQIIDAATKGIKAVAKGVKKVRGMVKKVRSKGREAFASLPGSARKTVAKSVASKLRLRGGFSRMRRSSAPAAALPVSSASPRRSRRGAARQATRRVLEATPRTTASRSMLVSREASIPSSRGSFMVKLPGGGTASVELH